MYPYSPITRFESYKDFYFMFSLYINISGGKFFINIGEVKEIKLLL